MTNPRQFNMEDKFFASSIVKNLPDIFNSSTLPSMTNIIIYGSYSIKDF